MELNFFKQHNGAVRITRKNFLLLLVVVFCVIFLCYVYSQRRTIILRAEFQTVYSTWPKLDTRNYKTQAWYEQNCFQDQFKPTLESLTDNLKLWSSATDDYCREFFGKFINIYNVNHRYGEIEMPNEFKQQVEKWLKGDQNLLKQVNHQYVVHIYNEYTREHAVFSPLRANRPQSKSETDPYEYSKKIIKESAKNCDFCDYEKHTSADIFGRIKTNRSVSAANTFKVDRWHSMILPRQHDVLEMNVDDVIDMYEAAIKWLQKVYSLEPIYKYPWIMWDIMPHAGASQIHPHAHVGLTPDYYVGMYENLRRGSELYSERFRSNFLSDLIQLHNILGLTVFLGDAVAMAQITSKKDTEVTIISPEPNKNFFQLLYFTYKAFMDMGFYDFSSLMVLPIMGSETKGSLPAIVRIASRGNVAEVKSEISSFELYQFSNLNVDPYKVIQHVNNSLLKRLKR